MPNLINRVKMENVCNAKKKKKQKNQLLQKLSKISDCSSLLVLISIRLSDSVAVAQNSERKKKKRVVALSFL